QSFDSDGTRVGYSSVTQSATATFSDPYTVGDVNADCDGLLAQWDLQDDVQYPWRNDGGVTRGPLVTYNERGETAPKILYFDDQGQPEHDTSLPPWPSQPDGAILGAPLPVHGPN